MQSYYTSTPFKMDHLTMFNDVYMFNKLYLLVGIKLHANFLHLYTCITYGVIMIDSD